jgi:hypothetical protein
MTFLCDAATRYALSIDLVIFCVDKVWCRLRKLSNIFLKYFNCSYLQKHRLWLQIWVIVQFVQFILTLITIIASTMGWVGSMGWSFNLLNIFSVAYRLIILKLICDFRESVPENESKDIIPSVSAHGNGNTTGENPLPLPLRNFDNPHPPVIRSGSKIISHVWNSTSGIQKSEDSLFSSFLNQKLLLFPKS